MKAFFVLTLALIFTLNCMILGQESNYATQDGLFLANPQYGINENSEETLTLTENSSNDLAILPGIEYLQRGIHLFNGDSIGTPPNLNLYDMTFNEGKSTTGINFKVPDFVGTTPDLAPDCQMTMSVESVFVGSSLEALETSSRSSNNGFSKTVDVGVSIPIGPATVSANTTSTTSLMFGNSNAQANQKAESQQNCQTSFSMSAHGHLYSAQTSIEAKLREQVTEEYSQITNDRQAFEFAKKYGTHFISRVGMGAFASKTIFTYEDSVASNSQNFKQKVNDHHFSLFGFHHDSSKTRADLSKIAEDTNIKRYSIKEINTGSLGYGDLEACSAFGNTSQPVPYGYELQPLWNHIQLQQYPKANSEFKEFVKNVYNAGVNCRAQYCNNKADCPTDNKKWNAYAQFTSYEDFFLNGCIPGDTFTKYYECMSSDQQFVQDSNHHPVSDDKNTFKSSGHIKGTCFDICKKEPLCVFCIKTHRHTHSTVITNNHGTKSTSNSNSENNSCQCYNGHIDSIEIDHDYNHSSDVSHDGTETIINDVLETESVWKNCKLE